MQTKILTAALFFAALGAAQDVDVGDFPRACQDACRDISRLSNECGDRTDNNRDERDCLCNANNAEQQATDCAACFKANRSNDNSNDDGDDLGEVFELCGWNYGAVAPASSSTGGSSTSTSSQVITTTIPGTTSTGLQSGNPVTSTSSPTTVTTTAPASPTGTDGGDNNAATGLAAGLGLLVAGLFAAI